MVRFKGNACKSLEMI